MPTKATIDMEKIILQGWQINQRMTIYLVENLPPATWNATIPGYDKKTVRMMAVHLHNIRCRWIKHLGKRWQIEPPALMNQHTATRSTLLQALKRSSKAMEDLLVTGIRNQNKLPGSSLGAIHFTQYMVAHEAHHRGQLLMAARQLGHGLPTKVTDRLWQWRAL